MASCGALLSYNAAEATHHPSATCHHHKMFTSGRNINLFAALCSRRARGLRAPKTTSITLLCRIVTRFVMLLTSPLVIALTVNSGRADEPTAEFDSPVATIDFFNTQVAPLLERACVQCHNREKREGGLALDHAAGLASGGESGPVIDRDNPLASALLKAIQPSTPRGTEPPEPPSMPKGRPALKAQEVAVLSRWIKAQAVWPANKQLVAHESPTNDWWSLKPLSFTAVPNATTMQSSNYIDAFIDSGIATAGLRASPAATPRELIRRLTFDLTGLPPSIESVEEFVSDSRPDAYERLVDRLIASPAYGERWARHWLDVVHYGETHGYDKDKLRLNAWPYRDYVIRAFNSDKPYRQFVAEQVAGDVIAPDDYEAIEAVGFLSAGPWDFIGHAEVPESKLDGRIARHLDRDDMVQNTFLTFQSLTVGCAQCHHHKFDPISQSEYYGLQAVFAALDRADRKYYRDPQLQARFADLKQREQQLVRQESAVRDQIVKLGGEELALIDKQLTAAKSAKPNHPAEHGYHSSIARRDDEVKWVQVDLGSTIEIARIEWIACHDDFASIGDGFGAPLRWKIEAAENPEFTQGVKVLSDHTGTVARKPGSNPGIAVQLQAVSDVSARFVRFTATKLATRQNDYIFALAELRILDADGVNRALGRMVTALDSIEAPIRWSKSNLVDDKYPVATAQPDVDQLTTARQELVTRLVPGELLRQQQQVERQLAELRSELKVLPPPVQAYVATIHYGTGSFMGTGPRGGQPRKVQVLPRGDVSRAGPEATPQALACVTSISHQLATPESTDGERRRALANWLTHSDNPLTWRSIANRLWSYHFQRGIVDTPNDFGRMGSVPVHPELLDRLAIDVRDHQSLKRLQRLIVTSATYQRSSQADAGQVAADPSNRFLARGPRKRLEAEAIRDSMLSVAGLLRREMGGASYQDFVIEHPEHSPHYEYALHDPRDAATMRRSIYRFIARSQTQPLMTSLDCADPSMQVDVRNESNSATQALTLLNNAFTLMAAEEWAERLSATAPVAGDVSRALPRDIKHTVRQMFTGATTRVPSPEEIEMLAQLADQHGLTAVARVIFNLNEFLYVD